MSGNELTAFDSSNLPAELASLFNSEDMQDDLSAGVQGGFGVVSIRGGKWRIKQGGEETPVVNREGEPVASLEVIILKANKNVSKIWYEKKFSEGDSEAPDCWSVDGIKPDPGSLKPQSVGCASCPQNQWGSRITENNKKAKACADNRRLAIVPVGDIENKAFGGPMLLRVPAASLTDLAQYGEKMQAKGFPYNLIATRIGFDMNVSFPKLTFKPIRPLTKDEVMRVAEHLKGDDIARVLSKSLEVTAAPAAAAPAEQPAVKEEPAKEEAKSQDDFEFEQGAPVAATETTTKEASPETASATVPAEDVTDDVDDELDSILADLNKV